MYQLISFRFNREVLFDECSKHRDIPEVDDEESEDAAEDKWEREDTIVEEGLMIHPGNDTHPEEECDNVNLCVSLVSLRMSRCLNNQMQNSCLVEDCIYFRNKSKDCKSYCLACIERSSEANNDKYMM